MRVYQKNLNKTAESIVNEILRYDGLYGMSFDISKAAYDWLYMNANSLASLVEEVLSDKLGGEYYVVVERYMDNGDYSMHVEYNKVEP